MKYVERAARKCEGIRDRLYPRRTWATWRFRQAVLASGSSDLVVLDVGCGRNGRWLAAVAPAFGKAYGIDPEAPNRSDGNIELSQASAYEIPMSANSVDVIAMRNVIEHLDDPPRALTECIRVLRPGGSLFVLTPNKWFPPLAVGRLFPHTVRWRINYLLRNAKESNTFPAYYRANTAKALARVSGKVGFVPETIEYFSEPPVYFTFSTLAYRCWAVFERRCLQKQSFAWLRHYVFGKFVLPR